LLFIVKEFNKKKGKNMKTRKKILHLNLLVLFVLISTHSYGQTYASIGVSVNILPRIEVIGEKPLNFGTLSPGDKINIDLESEMAGSFIIHSDKESDVSINFELPEYLSDGNGNKIPINFKNSDAGFLNSRSYNTVKRFNPNYSKRMEITKESRIFVGCDLEIPEDVTYFGKCYAEIRVIVEY
jgi:hypothetical protein